MYTKTFVFKFACVVALCCILPATALAQWNFSNPPNGFINIGNIGIGTSTPLDRLHINDPNAPVIRWTSDYGTGEFPCIAIGQAGLHRLPNSLSDFAGVGDLVIRTFDNPANQDEQCAQDIVISAHTQNGQIFFATRDAATQQDVPRMFVANNGNVRIGEPAPPPQTLLDIMADPANDATIRLSGNGGMWDISGGMDFGISNFGTGQNWLDFDATMNTTSLGHNQDVIIDHNNGTVSIGHLDPPSSVRLSIASGWGNWINLHDNFNHHRYVFHNPNGGHLMSLAAFEHDPNFPSDPNQGTWHWNIMNIQPNGTVGFGIVNTTHDVHMAGTFRVESDVQFDQALDVGGALHVEGASRFDMPMRIGAREPDVNGHNDYTLSVDGKIVARHLIITESDWADFVFDEDYYLPPLSEVEQSINANGHLPGIPSEEDVRRDGVSVSDMQVKLLQKVEELTLYTIDLDKRVRELSAENQKLRTELQNK